jgi:hypothetical protein
MVPHCSQLLLLLLLAADGRYETIPYFCLPANDLNDVIAPSCYSCFDYPNALADLVVRCCWRATTEHPPC